MNTMKHSLMYVGAMLFALGALTGCGGDHNVSGGAFYETGFHDPWYYGGGYYDRGDIIVTPPPTRPQPPVHPAQPIYRPSGPRPTPMPSIPSRPMARR